jgi:probable HAF family extracellular repeat protein
MSLVSACTRARCLGILASLTIAFAGAISAAPAFGGSYVIADLGVSGDNWSEGYAINATGATAGYFDFHYFNGDGRTAFRVTNGVRNSIAFVTPGDSIAYGINSSGWVTGFAQDPNAGSANRAFLFDGTSLTDIGGLPVPRGCEPARSIGYDINDAGTIVGMSWYTSLNKKTCVVVAHPVRYQGGVWTDLGCFPAYPVGWAYAVNSSGVIVGSCQDTSENTPHRGFYFDTAIHDVGDLGGGRAAARDINNSDTIVGDSLTGVGVDHAFLWRNGVMTDLGTLNPGGTSLAYSVNSYDEVVGDSDGHAFLYQNAAMVDLNQLLPPNSGWLLLSARGINDRGQIVGTGFLNGVRHAYLLTPTLLGMYAPELHYDAQETYYADSAAEITDNVGSSGSNKLYAANGSQIADADPNSFFPQLSLSFLGYQYPSGDLAGGGDYLDEANNYTTDYQALHAQPQYAHQIYGRDVAYPDGTHVLQYWFFLYYNQKYWLCCGAGVHEGDWEGIQIFTDASGTPINATYSQHDGAEVCTWSIVQRSGRRPIVYVAWGSHASYFRPGAHPVGGGFNDTANGDGQIKVPLVTDISASPLPSWVAWPGLWGASSGVDASPGGPGTKGDQWTDPLLWQASQSGCSEASLSARRIAGRGRAVARMGFPAPQLPSLAAWASGASIVVRYRFDSLSSDRRLRPTALVTTVVSADRRYAPLTVRTRIHRKAGTIVQPKGLGPGPYKVLASTLSSSGARSRTIAIQVK